MKRSFLIYSIFALLTLLSCSKDVTRIVCVGDSITEGAGLTHQSKTAYPVVLDSILGPNYSVLNCGRSGATLLKKSDLSYWDCKEFSNVFVFNPEVIIIKLGTNDSKGFNWNAERFASDYQALIDTFKTISSRPKIYVCLPAPAFKMEWEISDSTIRTGVIPIIEKIAKRNNLPIIDLYEGMSNQSQNFPDGIHPNEKGAAVMAGIIAKEIQQR